MMDQEEILLTFYIVLLHEYDCFFTHILLPVIRTDLADLISTSI